MTYFIKLILVALMFIQCTSTPKDNNIEEFNDSDKEPALPHPLDATRAATEELLISVTLPEAEEITATKEDILSLTKDLSSKSDFNKVQEKLVVKYQKDYSLAHWCFYTMVSDLEKFLTTLDNAKENKYQKFIDTMKTLWALSAALDKIASGEEYYEYLKKRYMQMASDYFGRQLH